MSAATPLTDLEPVAEAARATVLLHPLRLQVLRCARRARSATEIAAELGEPRQKVNYHVKELERSGFLHKAGRRRKRNFYEQRYRATARSYVLSPEILGPLAADWRRVEDRLSATYLLALAAQLQGELGRATREAAEQGKRLATLSLNAELRFESAAQRRAFATALSDAVTRVVAEHSSPARQPDGSPATGRPYRLVVGCYPIPPEAAAPPSDEPREEDAE